MPFIHFVKDRLVRSPGTIEVPLGANLMESLLAAGLPVASSCRGDGVCGKCRLTVTGEASLIGETEKYLIGRHDIPREMRVSCQVQVLGDMTVDASYW